MKRDGSLLFYGLMLVVAACLMAVKLYGDEPLTLDEARAYVLQNPEAAAEDVVALDSIERAVPLATMPEFVFSWTPDGVAVGWSGPLVLSIAGRLEYELTLPPMFAAAPKPDPWRWIVPAGAGALAGLVLGIVLTR